MSFPISGAVLSGPGLGPAADEAVSQPTSPHTPTYPHHTPPPRTEPFAQSAPHALRSAMSPGAAALVMSAGRSSGGPDLPRGEFYLGDMPLRAYVRSAQAERVKVQLSGSLERLAELLAAPDQHRALKAAIIRLWNDMDHSDARSAEMMGHGKRWLEQLVHQLESPSSVSSTDRAEICEALTRALTTDSMSPAKALGCALRTLQARMPGSSAANGFRSMLQERALMMWIATRAEMAQRIQTFGAREVALALLDGFGFSPERPRLYRTLPTVTVEELNQAAVAIENRLDSQVVPAAHEILTRVVDCVQLAYLYQPQSSTPLSPDQQMHLTATLKFMQTAMGLDLMNTLRVVSPGSGSSWSLANLTQLGQRINELLPELSTGPLSPDRPSGMAVHAAMPEALADSWVDALPTLALPVEGAASTGSSSNNSSPELELRGAYRQDRGSGATGTFSAGTGGASRRGPT